MDESLPFLNLLPHLCNEDAVPTLQGESAGIEWDSGRALYWKGAGYFYEQGVYNLSVEEHQGKEL